VEPIKESSGNISIDRRERNMNTMDSYTLSRVENFQLYTILSAVKDVQFNFELYLTYIGGRPTR
jgi:hypothetical protein